MTDGTCGMEETSSNLSYCLCLYDDSIQAALLLYMYIVYYSQINQSLDLYYTIPQLCVHGPCIYHLARLSG